MIQLWNMKKYNKTLVSISLIAIFCISEGSATADTFKVKAKEAINKALKHDGARLDSAHPLRGNPTFFVYNSDLKGKSPFRSVKCNKSISYSLYVKGKTQSGTASLGVINMGLCHIGTEVTDTLLKQQREMHGVIMPHMLKYLIRFGVRNGDEYHISNINADLVMHSFFVVAVGHGALYAPTSIVTSHTKGQAVILQFRMPPTCENVSNPKIAFCTDLDKAFAIMAKSLLQKE